MLQLELPTMPTAQAHQRQILESYRISDPRQIVHSLDQYSVGLISRQEATPLIMKYEWLGDMGGAEFFVGLISPEPEREIHGVACFGYGPAFPGMRKLIGAPALCLERGACVHYAPKNAASYLISRACRLIYRDRHVSCFFAYADPRAGEYGAVYQAAGWLYLGQGLDGSADGRGQRWFVLEPGLDPSLQQNWKTTRLLRRGKALTLRMKLRPDANSGENGWGLTFAEARAHGYRIEQRAAKHVYAINVGKDRRTWHKKMEGKPYPAPRPELKLKNFQQGQP
jgi:hypothetical protein